MTKFSANLGFLWTDLPLPDAIRAAADAGFDAVECHWPYQVPTDQVVAALQETGLPMLGLNTSVGDADGGERGLAAVPGREADARAAIDQALDYAQATATESVHVMAGIAAGADSEAAFLSNLTYACQAAGADGPQILIEPLNVYDAPGYFLTTSDHAVDIIHKVQQPNLKMMFDCYHVQLMEGDVIQRLKNHLPFTGHIQFASVPDRGPPDQGELNYRQIFDAIADLGYTAPLGAEYKPGPDTNRSLGWMSLLA